MKLVRIDAGHYVTSNGEIALCRHGDGKSWYTCSTSVASPCDKPTAAAGCRTFATKRLAVAALSQQLVNRAASA